MRGKAHRPSVFIFSHGIIRASPTRDGQRLRRVGRCPDARFEPTARAQAVRGEPGTEPAVGWNSRTVGWDAIPRGAALSNVADWKACARKLRAAGRRGRISVAATLPPPGGFSPGGPTAADRSWPPRFFRGTFAARIWQAAYSFCTDRTRSNLSLRSVRSGVGNGRCPMPSYGAQLPTSPPRPRPHVRLVGLTNRGWPARERGRSPFLPKPCFLPADDLRCRSGSAGRTAGISPSSWRRRPGKRGAIAQPSRCAGQPCRDASPLLQKPQREPFFPFRRARADSGACLQSVRQVC